MHWYQMTQNQSQGRVQMARALARLRLRNVHSAFISWVDMVCRLPMPNGSVDRESALKSYDLQSWVGSLNQRFLALSVMKHCPPGWLVTADLRVITPLS